MVTRNDLVKFLDDTLDIRNFSLDASNNGLQVEGDSEVKRVLFGVDACQEIFDAAIETDCQFIFVHHGISWGGGIYAAHLPLDAHPVYGNNACLSDMIGLTDRKPFFEYDGVYLGFSGALPKACTLDEIAASLSEDLEVDPILRGESGKIIRNVAIVSGGGGVDSIFNAKAAGCDLVITGEMTHAMHHPAVELNVAVMALGHYASETTGPLAMQKLVGETFGVETLFAEIPTGL